MRTTAIAMAALVLVACSETDVANRGEDGALSQEIEPVDIQSMQWFQESGVVEFNGREWILQGEPVSDPGVERVGEFQGMPLYAEVGVTPPYNELFIPLEDDQWQMLQEASPATPATGAGDEVPQGAGGVDPVGDPTDTGGGGGAGGGGAGGER